MQERGINSTFKKIIYESSEMVFLADDTYPYSIFYANEAFEEVVGSTLKERSLVGLGLDINAYIFKEELILSHQNKDFGFRLELPQDSASNYYLFYKGKEVRTHGLPNKKEAQQFFKSSLDLIAIGQHDYLTFLNDSVRPILGYAKEELLNTSICPFIHEQDLEKVQKIWKSTGEEERLEIFEVRFRGKDGKYKYLESSVQFTEDHFFIIARDNTAKSIQRKRELELRKLKKKAPEFSKVFSWEYHAKTGEFDLEDAGLAMLGNEAPILFEKGENEKQSFQKQLEPVLDKVLESVEAIEFNFDYLHPKGKLLILKGIVEKPEKDSNELVGLIWDETSKIELERNSKLHELLLLESPQPLLIVKPDGSVFLSNEEAIKLFGYNENQSIHHLRDLNILFNEEDQWKHWITSTENEAKVQRFSTLLISPQGKQLTLEVDSKSKTIQGELYLLLSFKNISEKVSLERTLEANSDFLMNLTEQVPGGLYQLVLDTEGKMSFSFLSKGISSVLGLNPQEIEAFTDISVAISRVHPADLPQVIMSSVASARKQEPWHCQFRVKTDLSSDNYQWVLGAARPQSLENGDMVWYGYLTDISKQKEFESKLDEARLVAEKANQIKSDFLSMISHELRTPLNAISGSTYSLLQEDPTQQQKTALNTINFAVDNLIIMINDLLDFQKIEAGKLTIEKTPFHLKDFVKQVIKGLSFHATDSKNKLELHLSEGLNISVKGDKTRMSQVLNNLITNALKFTNEGQVDVTVSLKESKAGKARVYFEVRDNGIGIAPEHQEKIFNDFDQVKPTFSAKYGGTGLGLSITRKLLNLMGGSIGLESAEGVGSRFYFELEFDVVKEESEVPNETNKEGDTPTAVHLLMAEDNDVNALVLGKIIKKWGFSFERVFNGQEAIDAVKSNGTFDCILMDIQMPVLDGFDATTEIKKISDSPVIALTAAAKLEIMERIEECGFDGFVAKPIDAAELLKKIREVIAERKS